MSTAFHFFKHFVGAEGNKTATAVVTALVKMDPDSASQADLATMEEDLDRAGIVIAKLRSDFNDAQKHCDEINARYTELMGAAEVLKKKIDAATDPSQKSSLEASLTNLVSQIEVMVPELDSDKKDVADTQSLLNEAEAAYKEKSQALLGAKDKLSRAKHDMEHAHIQEERSQARVQTAAEVAGLRSNSGPSGLNIALNAMNDAAKQARERAEANSMKASALNTKPSTDANIDAAMKEASGKPTEVSLSDRLAALKR